MEVSCIFQSCASSPNNAKVERHKSPQAEVWIMVKRKLTVGGLISHLASDSHYHYRKKNSATGKGNS